MRSHAVAAQSDALAVLRAEHSKVEARMQLESARLVALAVRANWPKATGITLAQEWDDDGDPRVSPGRVLNVEGEVLYDHEDDWESSPTVWEDIENGIGWMTFLYGSHLWQEHAPIVPTEKRGEEVRLLDIGSTIGAN